VTRGQQHPPTRVLSTASLCTGDARVRVSVLDVQGREVTVVAEGQHVPGRYTATWNGRGVNGAVPPGTYFIRYQTPVKNWVRRVVVAR
jgi:hypothetical protein